MTCHICLQGIDSRKTNHRIRCFHLGQKRSGILNLFFQFPGFFKPFPTECFPVFLIGKNTLHNLHARFFIRFIVNGYKHTKTVKGRSPKCPALRCHYRENSVLRIALLRKPVTLKAVSACLAYSKNRGQNVLTQKICVINIHDAAVSFIKQSRLQLPLAEAHSCLCINRAKKTVLRHAYRNLNPWHIRKLTGGASKGRFTASFFSAHQEPPGIWINERHHHGTLYLFHAAERGERVSLPSHASITLSTFSQSSFCSSNGRRRIRCGSASRAAVLRSSFVTSV